MKVEFVDRIESRTALNRHMFCPKCGSHGYLVVEQLEPETDMPWQIRCEQCGYDGPEAPTRTTAIKAWLHL